jgi:hypothetical protein
VCFPNELVQLQRQPGRNPQSEPLHGDESFLRSHQSLSYSQIFQHFTESEGSFVHQPTIGPYPEPDESNPYHLILFIHFNRLCLPSVVCYGLDGRGSNPGRGKIFLISTASRPALGSNQILIEWVPGAISPELERPGREDDRSLPSNAEVNGGAIPPLVFKAQCVINKAQGQLPFLSYLFPSGFPIKTVYAFMFTPCMLHALSVSSSFTWAFKLWSQISKNQLYFVLKASEVWHVIERGLVRWSCYINMYLGALFSDLGQYGLSDFKWRAATWNMPCYKSTFVGNWSLSYVSV